MSQRKRLGHKVDNPRLNAIHFILEDAESVEEACKLIEAGFDFVGRIHGAEIFRKRKQNPNEKSRKWVKKHFRARAMFFHQAGPTGDKANLRP